jgi:hypothetical protein
MTRETLVRVLLWYNVLSLGIWVGGTVFSMTVIVPIWSASPPESLRAFFQGTTYMTTVYNFFGPVTQVARALPLFVLAAVAYKYSAVRPWILACTGTLLFGLSLTRAYVYPLNVVLVAKAGGVLAAAAIRDLADNWLSSAPHGLAGSAGPACCGPQGHARGSRAW